MRRSTTVDGQKYHHVAKKMLFIMFFFMCAQRVTNAWLEPLRPHCRFQQQRWRCQRRNESPERTKRSLPHRFISKPNRISLNLLSRDDNNNSDRDPVLFLPLMEAELSSRVKKTVTDDDLEAAITDAKTAAELGVRKSQLQFYTAVSNGDTEALSKVWSETSHVRCVHPGMEAVEGRDAVMESWKRYFSVPVPPSVTTVGDSSSSSFVVDPERVRIDICGLIAVCSCVEKTQGGGQLEALNLYKRENGRWKMTLHQAGPIFRLL